MRPTVRKVEDVEDAIEAAKAIASDLGNQDCGKPISDWSLNRTLAYANQISRWASAELKENAKGSGQ